MVVKALEDTDITCTQLAIGPIFQRSGLIGQVIVVEYGTWQPSNVCGDHHYDFGVFCPSDNMTKRRPDRYWSSFFSAAVWQNSLEKKTIRVGF